MKGLSERFNSIKLSHIILVGLILKLAFFCYLAPWNKTTEKEAILTGDGADYNKLAMNILKYHSMAPPSDTNNFSNATTYHMAYSFDKYLEVWRLPAYPAFIAGVYKLFGIHPFIVILIQLLLSTISVALLYKICILLFNQEKIAIVAAMLYSIDIHSIYVANLLLTDTLTVMLMLAATYYLIKGINQQQIGNVCMGGVFIGLACLTRPAMLLFPVILIGLVLLKKGYTFKWKFRALFMFTTLWLILPVLWSFHNHSKYNSWQLTDQGGYSLLMFNVAYAQARVTNENVDTVRVRLQEQADALGFRQENNIFKRSDIYEKVALAYMGSHAMAFTSTYMWGSLHMFLSLGNLDMSRTLGWEQASASNSLLMDSKRLSQNFQQKKEMLLALAIILVLALQYTGALYGAFKSFASHNVLLIILTVGSILYFTLITGSIGMYRYKLPITPFICILAGLGYTTFMERSNNKSNNLHT